MVTCRRMGTRGGAGCVSGEGVQGCVWSVGNEWLDGGLRDTGVIEGAFGFGLLEADSWMVGESKQSGKVGGTCLELRWASSRTGYVEGLLLVERHTRVVHSLRIAG